MKESQPNTPAADDGDAAELLLRERIDALPNAGERRTFAASARELRRLPADRARAAAEVSASLAGVALRLSFDFLRAAPDAARLLTADELRQWGETGRRLALERNAGAEFFDAGVTHLAAHSADARRLLFETCARQMRLSLLIARDTFARAGTLAASIDATNSDVDLTADANDTRTDDRLARVYEVALEISHRSAKHSADFLRATPDAVRALRSLRLDDEKQESEIIDAALALAAVFASRAGGVAAEAWAALPEALNDLTAADARQAFALAAETLERGGAAALQALTSGGTVLRRVPGAFAEWAELLRRMGAAGTPALVQFARLTPEFLRRPLDATDPRRNDALTARVLRLTSEIAEQDTEAALALFRSTPQALRSAGVEQFERWAREGLTFDTSSNAETKSLVDSPRARRSYYALETRRSHERLHEERRGLALDDAAPTLRLYVEALTNRQVEVQPLASAPAADGEAPIDDGRTLHLPATVAEFEDDDLNFRLYKVLAAHAAGQIEFGTHARGTIELRAAYGSLAELYAEDAIGALDAFSLSGYIEDVRSGERALPIDEERRLAVEKRKRIPADVDFRRALLLFPETGLARRIFGTLENARIDRRLRHTYKGLRRDLDFVRERLSTRRPNVIELPVTIVPFELLFQITLCGGATDDARRFYPQIVSELESIVADHLAPPAGVADTLVATSRAYALFRSVAPRDPNDDSELIEGDDAGDAPDLTAPEADGDDQADSDEAARRERAGRERNRRPAAEDARELFDRWARQATGSDADLPAEGEARALNVESIERELAPGETAHSYDEWDRELADARVGWCRVVERAGKIGDRTFVELARSRHRGIISSIRHQFQLMRPEGLRRVRGQYDGDDYDLDAVVEHVTDRRAARRSSTRGADASERLYTARLRRERDVSVAFLLDQSSSTARTIGRHPLQPYTHPGRRIIDIEKEGLILMSEALESVGDPYAIYGFTSEGRRNVRFYVVKDFDDALDARTESRIGGITYEHNTRTGAAVRHASSRLSEQGASTRLLIILSDGRPYDHDYGDAAYAREDTRASLRDARLSGITPFCITIDRDSEQELRDLYGDVGYTIIDDVLSLPERLPAIYRRLTT